MRSIEPVAEPPYQPIEGCDLPALQPCVERWEMMKPWLKGRRVIDLGCHTGWFCRKFAREGWTVFGVDRSEEWIGTAKQMNAGIQFPPMYLVADVFTLQTLPKVDVALCLSLVMYLFDDVRRGWELLKRVSEHAPQMFMDFGGQYASRLPFGEATVVEQMLEHTVYTSAQLLGHTAFESRPMFLFSR